MQSLVGAALGAALLVPPAAQAAEEAPLMRVLIKPAAPMSQAAGKGDVDVVETIPGVEAPAGAPLLSISLNVPGLSRPQKLEDLQVSDAAGPVPMEARQGRGAQWAPTRAVKGELTVRYRLAIENVPALSGGPPTGMRIDGDGFDGVGGGLLMAPRLATPYRIAITWDLTAMGPGAEGVSSWGDGDVDLLAGPVSRLGSTVFMAGHVQRQPQKGTASAFSAVWLGDPGWDPHESMAWTGKLHAAMSRFFHDKTEPAYRVFLRYNPMNAGGGAAFPHSFIATYGTGVNGENLKSILGHEMTHTWTATSLGSWYNEGDAVYYQTLLAWRAGLLPTEAYLADLNLTASRYYTNPLKALPEDQVDPHFWEDTRIRVLPYDRGAMYFAVLDGRIRKASGGKRSIDDLIRNMVERARDGQPVSQDYWLGLLRQDLGEEGPAIHKAMMAGGLMLPESDGFGPCFHRTVMKIRQFELGYDPKSLIGEDRTIRGLMPNSEAAKAGVKDGDKVSYGVALDAVQADVNRTFTLHVTRDGKTFDITYLPRGQAVDAYQWARTSGVPDSACRF